MKKIGVAIGIVVAIIIVISAGWYVISLQKSNPPPMEKITISSTPFETVGLLWIADERHFFEENGLNVTIRRVENGAIAFDDVVNGRADLAAGSAEYALAAGALRGDKALTIGSINKGNLVFLVARKDRGILNVSDLKGKRIGTTPGTVTDFHLGRFLTLQGMSVKDIIPIAIRDPADLADAVAGDRIDAVVTAQPFANRVRDDWGEQGLIWNVQSGQQIFGLVVANNTWLSGHPDTARRFLMSLAQAEQFLQTHPAESRAIVQERAGIEPGYMDTVWQQNQFSLSLDQSLVTAMEDESRWMIANNLTNATAVPDFGKYIYPDALDKVKPGSVHLIV